jgi:hypothetical protein
MNWYRLEELYRACRQNIQDLAQVPVEELKTPQQARAVILDLMNMSHFLDEDQESYGPPHRVLNQMYGEFLSLFRELLGTWIEDGGLDLRYQMLNHPNDRVAAERMLRSQIPRLLAHLEDIWNWFYRRGYQGVLNRLDRESALGLNRVPRR